MIPFSLPNAFGCIGYNCPPGSYRNTCSCISIQSGCGLATLYCSCKKIDGTFNEQIVPIICNNFTSLTNNDGILFRE